MASEEKRENDFRFKYEIRKWVYVFSSRGLNPRHFAHINYKSYSAFVRRGERSNHWAIPSTSWGGWWVGAG